MNKKWIIRLTLPDSLALKETRDWCKENCYHEFKVRLPQAGRSTILHKKPYVAFQNEIDAMAFKMRWL